MSTVDYKMLDIGETNLFPKVLLPTPVGPRRTILGWGRVSMVQPHSAASSPERGGGLVLVDHK